MKGFDCVLKFLFLLLEIFYYFSTLLVVFLETFD